MGTTQLQHHKQELLKLKAEGKELLQQLFALKDEKRAALVELLKDASPENQKTLRSIYQTNNKNLNEKWRSEHADLIARFGTLKEQVKSDNALLQELLEQAKKIGPADEQFYRDLEALFLGKQAEELAEAVKTVDNLKAHHKEKALGTITESDLLNKPNMTAEDKQKMQDTLDFMKSESELRTDENLKKLYDNVHYHHSAIEIASCKWSRSYRKSTKVGPNTPSYISDQNDVYKPRAFFKRKTGLHYFNHEAALEEAEEMKKNLIFLPSEEDFEATLKALPGDYKREKPYLGGNIFNLLFNGKDNFTGYCDSSGSLKMNRSYSCLQSGYRAATNQPWVYRSEDLIGALEWGIACDALPIRPIMVF